MKNLVVLAENYPQMSEQSGLAPFFKELIKQGVRIINVSDFELPELRRVADFLRKVRIRPALLPRSNFSPHNRWIHQYAATEMLELLSREQETIVLLSDVENQFTDLLAKAPASLKSRIAGICHQHPAWYKLNGLDIVAFKGLRCLFVFSEDQKVFFDAVLDIPIIKINHGVDLDFFKPNQQIRRLNKVLFVGSWQRDFELLGKIVLNKQPWNEDVNYSLVIPLKSRTPEMYKLAAQDNVNLYHDLTSIELRNLYYESTCVVLPLITATANNTLVEAMATSTPTLVNYSMETRFYSENIWEGVIPVEPSSESFIMELERVINQEKEISQINEENLKLLDWVHTIIQIKKSIK
jgi:glycosyltransferase involved in cell wall biosynthesis